MSGRTSYWCYIFYDTSIYELPVAYCENIKEVANFLKRDIPSTRSSISHCIYGAHQRIAVKGKKDLYTIKRFDIRKLDDGKKIN